MASGPHSKAGGLRLAVAKADRFVVGVQGPMAAVHVPQCALSLGTGWGERKSVFFCGFSILGELCLLFVCFFYFLFFVYFFVLRISRVHVVSPSLLVTQSFHILVKAPFKVLSSLFSFAHLG